MRYATVKVKTCPGLPTKFPAEQLSEDNQERYTDLSEQALYCHHFQTAMSPFLWQGMKLQWNLYKEKQSS